MMDRDRGERRRESSRDHAVEAFQESHRVEMEDVFALQERTLEFARSLLERLTEVSGAEAESNRVVLEDLAEQARIQREAFRTLPR